MSEWAAKRFWKRVDVIRAQQGFAVALDGRPLRTPAKAEFVVPTQEMAGAVCDEWQAQGEHIDPLSMPVTRSTNAALDKVVVQQDDVVNMLADYGDCDLICYRAEHPDALVVRQAQGWDPLVAWSAAALSAPLEIRHGVMHTPQSPETLPVFRAHLARFSVFELAAVHDLVTLSGSLVLALAVAKKHIEPARAWKLSRIEEDWQSEQWGIDEQAQTEAEAKKSAFLHAAGYYGLCS